MGACRMAHEDEAAGIPTPGAGTLLRRHQGSLHIAGLRRHGGRRQHAVIGRDEDEALGHPAVDLLLHHAAHGLVANPPATAVHHEDDGCTQRAGACGGTGGHIHIHALGRVWAVGHIGNALHSCR